MTTRSSGVILAGGQATRLGPLAAQLNKALVSVRQRPILVHQALAFYEQGVRDIYIVANPDAIRQLHGVTQRALNLPQLRFTFVPQDAPLGPGHALALAARAINDDGPVLVTMADTYFDADDLAQSGDWVGIHETNLQRNWCLLDSDGAWVERVPQEHEKVTAAVGLYHFSSGARLLAAANAACRAVTSGEVLMAQLLNNYDQDRELSMLKVKSWQDVGDIAALAQARRERFNSRTFNELNMNKLGIVTKRGTGPGFQQEAAFMESISYEPHASLLFPRLIGKPRHDEYESYQMEFVDLPTLGELYLYWPGRPELWAHVLDNVLDLTSKVLWPLVSSTVEAGDIWHRGEAMYLEKPRDRFDSWDSDLKHYESLQVNSQNLEAGLPLIERLNDYLKINVLPGMKPAMIHGDLNFANILYSLGSDTFKLVDPRGEWGEPGGVGDTQYELAKLRYSYSGFFPAIIHHLWSYDRSNYAAFLDFGVQRKMEIAAMDEVLINYGANLQSVRAIEASLFISGAPLHPGQEGEVMYLQGVRAANEVLQ